MPPVVRLFDKRAGSTVPYVVERIIQQGKEVNKGRVFIPTGAWRSFCFPDFISPVSKRFPVEAVDR